MTKKRDAVEEWQTGEESARAMASRSAGSRLTQLARGRRGRASLKSDFTDARQDRTSRSGDGWWLLYGQPLAIAAMQRWGN